MKKQNEAGVDADKLRAEGYDAEDIALITDEKLWADINATEAEEEFVVWHPGMFGGSKSKEAAERKSSVPRSTSKPPLTTPLRTSAPIPSIIPT